MSEPFSYDKEFQQLVLAAMVQKPALLLGHRGVLQPSYFTDPVHELLADTILTFYDDWSIPPVHDVLKELVRRGQQLTGVTIQVAGQIVDKIYQPFDNLDFVAVEALTFCRVTAVMQATTNALPHLQRRDIDAVIREYDKAFAVGRYLRSGLGLKFLSTDAPFTDIGLHTMPTGLPHIDRAIQGGLGPKELGIILGVSGAGKSMALMHIGKTAIWCGKKVVHYTLELSQEFTYARYDSSISGVPFSDLPFALAKVSAIKRKLNRWFGDSLLIKEFPTRGASVRDLKAHLDMVRAEMWKPDLIIVDYADLMLPTRTRDELWAEATSTYEELRGVAMEMGVPVWTASQGTRDAFDREVVGQQHVSDSIGKARTADVVLTIAQTPDMRANRVLRLHLAKARRGEGGLVVDIRHDFRRAQFMIMPDDLDARPQPVGANGPQGAVPGR